MEKKTTKKVELLLDETTDLIFLIRSIAVASSLATDMEANEPPADKKYHTGVRQFCFSDLTNMMEILYEKADKALYNIEMLDHVEGFKDVECELW